MIEISKLYCGSRGSFDEVRYGGGFEPVPAKDRRPVVVWNMTRRCNLSCVHCYSSSGIEGDYEELTTGESRELLDGLSEFKCPVILFSGGEPLLREDLPELVKHAAKRGLRTVISTNGTLITEDLAGKLADSGISYVGVSLDGKRETHDGFRRVMGAFDRSVNGMRICRSRGIKVGIRFTITRRNVGDIPYIFELMEAEDIQRACFYHLVYSGRGSEIMDDDLTHDETRRAVDLIMEESKKSLSSDFSREILTVDNHADGPYIYLRLIREDPARAAEVHRLLKINGGNNSGTGLGCISWNGDVYPDQFWRTARLGNVRERPFAEIWTDVTNELMMKLKDRKKHLRGRCADCRWIDLCGGNFRVRAEAVTGDIWASDPACYLTDDEIVHR